jgi:starvation-inducible DNA-binding protein
MNMKPLINLFADNFTVYSKAHGYHFNVVGPDFFQYHKLFQEVYDYLYEQHDILGELIRQNKAKVPTGLKDICDLTVMDCELSDPKALDMVEDLKKDLESLVMAANALYEGCADPACETVIGDYVVGINKLRWFLESTIK